MQNNLCNRFIKRNAKMTKDIYPISFFKEINVNMMKIANIYMKSSKCNINMKKKL